jgi:iron complex outermembrane receptor protein
MSVALLAVAGSAWADSEGLEEVVVTAQKREQLAKDVGIAITAYSAEQMDKLGFETSTDLIAYTPGVSLAGDIGGQRAIFNIRGIVQNDYADLAEAPVAMYIDGGYVASTQAQTFGLFDVERVEILKGPQGTLFGRNATGGLVDTITRKPTKTLEGYAQFLEGSFDQHRAEGAVSGPLADSVSGRLSFLVNEQGEIYHNLYKGTDYQGTTGTPGGGQNTENDDTVAVRGQVNFDIGDRGNLLISGNYARTLTSEGPYHFVATTEVRNAKGEAVDVILSANDPMNCDIIQAGACISGVTDGSTTRPVKGGDFWGNTDPGGNYVNKDFAFKDQNRIGSAGAAAELNYDFGGAKLTSLSDYKNFTRVIGLDSDQTARAGLVFQSYGDINQLSQELRLAGVQGRMTWVSGLYYLRIHTHFIQGLAGSANGPNDFGLQGVEANTITQLNTDSYSIFGQSDYKLTDDLTLVTGVRLIEEDKGFRGKVGIFQNNDDRSIETEHLLATLEQLSARKDNLLWSGKFELEYSPDKDRLYYAGVNRGVKAGSFNAPLFGGLSGYNPERLLAYEVGAKFTVMNGRAQINTALYHYDYHDYQSFSFRNNNSKVTNEQATSNGGEVDLLANPIARLDVSLGVSYIDATVKHLQITSDSFRNVRPPFTPAEQVAGLLRYNWDNVFQGNFAAQVSGSWKSDFFYSAKNFTAHRFGSSLISNARLTWKDRSALWEVAAFVDNFMNRRDPVIGFDVSSFYGTEQVSYSRPRSFGAQLRRNF